MVLRRRASRARAPLIITIQILIKSISVPNALYIMKAYWRSLWLTRYLKTLAYVTLYIKYCKNREYFTESAGVRYLRTSFWRIRNRTSERSERVRFLIQKQRVRKYRTKHFPCGILFIIYILRHSSFWRPFTHLRQNGNENEVSAF